MSYKYKNISKGILDFRAFDPKGDKIVCSVEPGKIIELRDKTKWPGLELVKEKKKIKENEVK